MGSFYKHKVPPGKYPHITKEFLIAERAAGKSVNQIAEDNKVPRGTISTMMTKWGLSAKRGDKPSGTTT